MFSAATNAAYAHHYTRKLQHSCVQDTVLSLLGSFGAYGNPQTSLLTFSSHLPVQPQLRTVEHDVAANEALLVPAAAEIEPSHRADQDVEHGGRVRTAFRC